MFIRLQIPIRLQRNTFTNVALYSLDRSYLKGRNEVKGLRHIMKLQDRLAVLVSPLDSQVSRFTSWTFLPDFGLLVHLYIGTPSLI